MKLLALITLSMVSLSAVAGEAGVAKPGTLICSLTSPKTTGFELVKVRGKDRAYNGFVDIENLRVSGSYQSSSASFYFKVSALDEDGEVSEDLLTVESKLFAGQFFHSKSKHGDVLVSLYCHFIPNLSSQ